jgi:hypothetical protein
VLTFNSTLMERLKFIKKLTDYLRNAVIYD